MSLIACPACEKQVSEAAAACPHCGHPIASAPAAAPTPAAPAATPSEDGGFGIFKMLGWFFGGLLLFFVIFAVGRNDPESEARMNARSAIDLCWKEQARKSLDPGTARFVAGTCEMMTEDFKKKYGVNP